MVISFFPVLKDQAFYNNTSVNSFMASMAQHNVGSHRNLTEHLNHWAPVSAQQIINNSNHSRWSDQTVLCIFRFNLASVLKYAQQKWRNGWKETPVIIMKTQKRVSYQ